MLNKKFFLVPLAVSLLILGCSACGTVSGGFVSDTVISSYIRTWGLDPDVRQDSPYWEAGMVNAKYLTDLNIAFALIYAADKHTIYIPGSFYYLWEEVAELKKQNPRLKINISVGGWGADHFSGMADDETLRAQFAEGVCDWLEEYGLDGIDIDWEYPVGPPWGQQIESSPRDRGNYIALLRCLRDAMNALGNKTGKYYSLSTAVPASDWFVKANNVVAAADIVDALKLMSYDYYGSWTRTTGHLCNLYPNPRDPEGAWSTDQALRAYLATGVPPEKIQLGLAFYGIVYGGVSPGSDGTGLYQPYKDIPRLDGAGGAGSVSWHQIKELLKPGSGYTRYWDNTAKAPYLYNGDIWISYCDEEQIKALTAYAKSKGLGGFFSWEYGHDMNAELLKVLAENAR